MQQCWPVLTVLLRVLQNTTIVNTPTLLAATSFKDFLSRLPLITGGSAGQSPVPGLSYNGMIALPLPILLFRPRMIADMTQGLITHSDPNIHTIH